MKHLTSKQLTSRCLPLLLTHTLTHSFLSHHALNNSWQFIVHVQHKGHYIHLWSHGQTWQRCSPSLSNKKKKTLQHWLWVNKSNQIWITEGNEGLGKINLHPNNLQHTWYMWPWKVTVYSTSWWCVFTVYKMVICGPLDLIWRDTLVFCIQLWNNMSVLYFGKQTLH